MRPLSQAANPVGLKIVALVMAFGLAFYFLAPPSSWQQAIAADPSSSITSLECPPCICECPSDSDSLLLPGMVNTPSSDCEKAALPLKESLDKNSIQLLSEELKLQESIAEESQVQADLALLDAKKLASQYQKEAEKCSSGMGTCEEAREKSEAALAAQKRVSAMWETRARELGWRDKAERQSLFSRIGLASEEGQGDSLFKSRK